MSFEESRYRHARFESLSDIVIETESSIELVTDLEIDDPIVLPEPTIEALNTHVHEENLRPCSHIVSLTHILLKYYEKIR